MRVRSLTAAALVGAAVAGCGARTGLYGDDIAPDTAEFDAGLDAAADGASDAGIDAGPDAAPDAARDAGPEASVDAAPDAAIDSGPPECVIDSDCSSRAKFCSPFACIANTCILQPTPACDDSDVCTDDRCDLGTDRCVNAARTFDLDGDGFRGPLPGMPVGDPQACGTDCNDGDPRIRPLARELCNTVDDNCDGLVDENSRYQPIGSDLRLSPLDVSLAGVTGLTPYADGFALAYGAAPVGSSRLAPFVGRFSTALARIGTDLDLTALSPADGDGGRTAWAGDRFGLTWSDRRQGNYEVFFALANASMQKLAPGDIRLSRTSGFSLGPSVLWTGRDFLVVWQDEARSGYEIHAVRVSPDGSRVGNLTTLRSGGDARSVGVVALPAGGYVLAWLEGSSIGPVVTARVNVFRLDENLIPMTGPVQPIAGVVSGGPSLTYFDGRVAVAAHATSGVATVAVLDATTLATTATVALADGRIGFGRDVAVLGIGSRLAAAWADDRDDQRTFEIYLQTFDSGLRPAAPPTRVTTAPSDSVSPVLAAFGSADAVVAWNDGRNGRSQVYGRALQCSAP